MGEVLHCVTRSLMYDNRDKWRGQERQKEAPLHPPPLSPPKTEKIKMSMDERASGCIRPVVEESVLALS